MVTSRSQATGYNPVKDNKCEHDDGDNSAKMRRAVLRAGSDGCARTLWKEGGSIQGAWACVQCQSPCAGRHLAGMDSGQEGVRLGRSTTRQARPTISAFGWDKESRQITLIWHRDQDLFLSAANTSGICAPRSPPLCSGETNRQKTGLTATRSSAPGKQYYGIAYGAGSKLSV